jgi:hypothetical protein
MEVSMTETTGYDGKTSIVKTLAVKRSETFEDED